MEIFIIIGSCTIIIYISISQLLDSNITVTKSNIDKGIEEFLNEADNAYMRMYRRRDVNEFAKYATFDLCSTLAEDIVQSDEKLFGVDKYRSRQWFLVENNEEEYLFKKEITHRCLEITRGVKVSIGDDMNELWKVKRDGKKYKVFDII